MATTARPLGAALAILAAAAGGLLLPAGAPAAAQESPVALVDPLIGTAPSAPNFGYGGGGGNVFPGAAFPFGMLQWTPVTVPEGFGGYDYRARRLLGFPLTALSGAGCQAFGEFPFIPAAVPPSESPERDLAALASPFSHRRERARAGDYRADLRPARVELAAGRRAATGRFTFKSRTGTLLLRSHSYPAAALGASLRVSSARELRGTVEAGRLCSLPSNRYRVHMVARFDRPFRAVGSWEEGAVSPGVGRAEGPRAGLWVSFDTRRDRDVRVHVAISLVDQQGAARNLAGDRAGFDIERRRREARRAWRSLLGRVRVRGGSRARRRVFYTALYRSLIHPNLISDRDGRYPGPDGLPRAARHPTYGNFAGWDFHRAQAALLAMVAPRVASDLAQSLVDAGDAQAGMPRWSLAGRETGLMVGDPSVPAIATMHAFGARRFDVGRAFELGVRSATDPGLADQAHVARPGLASYVERGYIPPDPAVWGEVSTTLEYATADFALARMARRLGRSGLERILLSRSGSWRNVFNPARRVVQPRLADGTFEEPFDPVRDDGRFDPVMDDGFVEGNALQYTWAVPQDLGGVVGAVGGRRAASRRLRGLLRELNGGPNRPHAFVSNQSGLLHPWVPNWVHPPLAQRAVRRTALELYRARPRGLPGNDDLGALSAAAVFAHLGLYPAVPGVGGLTVVAPVFSGVELRPGGGRPVRMRVASGRTGGFIRSARLGRSPLRGPWVSWETLLQRRRLDLRLSARPGRWGVRHPPPSYPRGKAR